MDILLRPWNTENISIYMFKDGATLAILYRLVKIVFVVTWKEISQGIYLNSQIFWLNLKKKYVHKTLQNCEGGTNIKAGIWNEP